MPSLLAPAQGLPPIHSASSCGMRDRPQGEVGAQPDRKPATAPGDFSVSPIFRDSQYSNPREVWRRTGDSNSETTCGVADVLKPERTIGHHWQQSQAPAQTSVQRFCPIATV